MDVCNISYQTLHSQARFARRLTGILSRSPLPSETAMPPTKTPSTRSGERTNPASLRSAASSSRVVPAWHTRAGRRQAASPFRTTRPSTRGYLLIESLTALAVLGVGLLPLATLAPVVLGALRHYEILAHATRAAAELAELEQPAMALSPLHARGIGPDHLRLCRSLIPAGGDDGLPGCTAGPRLAVVGPLRSSPTRPGGVHDAAALRVVALWIRP